MSCLSFKSYLPLTLHQDYWLPWWVSWFAFQRGLSQVLCVSPLQHLKPSQLYNIRQRAVAEHWSRPTYWPLADSTAPLLVITSLSHCLKGCRHFLSTALIPNILTLRKCRVVGFIQKSLDFLVKKIDEYKHNDRSKGKRLTCLLTSVLV